MIAAQLTALQKHSFCATACLFLAMFFCCLGILPAQAAEQELMVYSANLENTPAGTFAALSCSVSDEDALRDLLKDGATIELSISFDIEGKRSWWSNAELLHKTFISKLTHDPLTREFAVTLPGATGPITLRQKNLTRLIHQSWRNLRLPLLSPAERASLDPEREHTLRITFYMHHVEVPPWLEQSTLFWSPDVAPQVILEKPFPVTQQ